MGLREIGETLPPGFRFNPSDQELICYYLYKKISNEDAHKGTLVDVDLHTCEPWQLPDVAKLNANEWYFFSFRDRKYATGCRTNRATISGYWKATGKDRSVMDSTTSEVVGMRKTLVFYKNRAPNGTKTGWIMHEFRLESAHMAPKEDWVLCRVFHKRKGSEGTNQSIMETDYSSPEYLVTNNNYSAPNSSKTNMSAAAGYHQISSLTPSSLQPSPILDERLSLSMSKWNSMFELRHEEWKDATESASHVTEMAMSKQDDDDTGAADYGFLYEMGLDDNHSLVSDEILPSSTDVCMLFEAENSIVFQ